MTNTQTPSPTTIMPARSVEDFYQDGLKSAVDICEHMPLLRELASRCDHVTEMGVRYANGSTPALLAGLLDHAEPPPTHPRTLISWDLDPMAILRCFQLWAQVGDGVSEKRGLIWQPRVGNSLDVAIESTDLLFIDTLHTYDQLQSELIDHHDEVGRYIVLHDTETFGERGEDGHAPGLLYAMQEFLDDHRDTWFLAELRVSCNGLAVLERRSA